MLALLSVLVACRPEIVERTVSEGRFGTVALVVPAGTPEALAFVFSDVDGWSPAYGDAARRLARDGMLIVGVDLSQYLRNLAASDDGCHYVVAEIEDLSERLQREFRFGRYQSPVLVGIGAGGTLAYAALAQAPAATVGGAISVDPAFALGTKVSLCEGAPAHAVKGRGYSYGPQPKLPGWWRVSALPQLSASVAAVVQQSNGEIVEARGAPLERVVELVLRMRAEAGLAALPAALARLPLAVLPAASAGPVMAVIYSGDGGWRDIDKQIGETLAATGTPVIGVDCLRYFWKPKTPATIAGDLSEIMRRFGADWGRDKVVLVGYSFGANVLPFAVNALSNEDRSRVVQVSLLGLETHTEFEIRVSGWFGGAAGSAARPVLPEIQQQQPVLFQCFYGEEEEDTLCPKLEGTGVEVIRTSGGHHFDGNYRALAEKISTGAARRLSAATGRK